MNPILKLIVLILFAGVFFHISCKKEYSCENCKGDNKPPIADAGNDTSLILPVDSIILDGSKSSDPDDGISRYDWKKIAGPDTFNIDNKTAVKTTVIKLVKATYSFELTVTDKGGLSAKDTMQVIVNPAGATNRAPLANAGKDTTIYLPVNTVLIDGGGSTDPENNIASYLWTKISGPSAFIINNSNAVQTQVTNLVVGIYQFELKVTDAAGLFSKDTIQIVLNQAIATCTPVNRPSINAQLVPFGKLTEARGRISVASAGNKILFAGGQKSSGEPSAVVDIYDIVTQTWSATQLSLPRNMMAAIADGDKIYFAGGISTNDIPSSRIDIYDVASNSWSIAELSEPRSAISAAAIGSKIMFAGGYKPTTSFSNTSDKVDIYDSVTNGWSTATLSMARTGLSATTAGNKIYFAGGYDFGYGVYNNIDIYNNTTNTWTTSVLSEQKSNHGAIASGNYIYWGGGEIHNNFNDYGTTCKVERRDLLTGTSTILHLFQESFAHSNSQPAMEVLLKSGLIVFYTGGSQFDIYDPGSDIWSIGVMNQGLVNAGVISVYNVIYIAGGGMPFFTPSTNQVWKLEF